MKNIVLEISSEKDFKLNKEKMNKLKFEVKSVLELEQTDKNVDKKFIKLQKKEILLSNFIYFIDLIYIFLFNGKKEKRAIIKRNDQKNLMNINKNAFLEFKNIFGKYLSNKDKKENIKKYCKNNNKKNRINIRKNTYIIIIIFFNLISQNNNMIEYKFSNITLKIQGPGFSNILSRDFNEYDYPDIIYINGNQNFTITNRYYFNEENNTVNLIWNKSIDNCEYMFRQCSNITEIDLSNFDASNVQTMYLMFDGCSKLSSLDLSNFNTSSAKIMHRMFGGCSQLSSLNLSSFDTSKVTEMGGMFQYCSKLTSLNLSNFNTSNVVFMNSMFTGCSKLPSINLSNFDTSKVVNMHYMFSSCSQLSSLNLSNFDTLSVTSMINMFSFCPKLEYINLKNFEENNSLDIQIFLKIYLKI